MEEMKYLNRKAEVPKPTDLNYRIGLDIGIASVGWAVLENNTHDEPFRIIDLGVRIFDTAEQPKTGASLALPRREARSARRRLRRRGHRLERIKKLFEAEGLINIEEFEARYKRTGLPDVYKLRYEGLTEGLLMMSWHRFCCILLSIEDLSLRARRQTEPIRILERLKRV